MRRGALRGAALAVALASGALVLGACASSKGGGGSAEQPKAAAEKNVGKPAPAGSPLSKVQVGMNDSDVRNVLGSPDKANGYVTGKAFVPFYYGGDTSRTDWIYSGQGRVVFSRNQWSGALKVIRVDYDPSL
jgi:hypothetical protein